MATIVNAREVSLQATSPRVTTATGFNAVTLVITASASVVSATSAGVVSTLPTGITLKLYVGNTYVTTGVTYGPTTTSQNNLTVAVAPTTGVLTISQPGGWTASNQETFSLTATYDGVVYTTLYTIAKALGGSSGSNGTRTAVLELYRWSASAPTAPWPSGTSTYTWSTGLFSAPATLNGWSVVPPAAVVGQVLYTIRQIFSDSGTSATSDVTWAATTSYPTAASGSNGSNGQRVGILEVYRWKLVQPTTGEYPTGSSTYTWADGSFSAPSNPNGWSVVPPAAVAGQTLWGISVSVSDTLTTSTSSATWNSTTPYAVGYAGSNGSVGGTGTSNHRVYIASAIGSPPSTPGNTTSGGTPVGWSATPVSLTAGQAQWQSDGTTLAGGTVTTWAAPYESYLKVGSLSAITTNTGALTVTGNISVTSGSLLGGTFTGYAWPASGGTGFYLGPSGLLLGNLNDGRYFQADAGGNVYAPGLSIVNGVTTLSQLIINANGTISGGGGGQVTAPGIDAIQTSLGNAPGSIINDNIRVGGVNLAGNTGFRRYSGGVPTGWTVYNNGNISVSTEVRVGEGLFGQNSFRVTTNAITNTQLGLHVLTSAAEKPVWIVGQKHIISFWARGFNGAVGQPMTGVFRNNPQFLAENLESPVLSNGWQRWVQRVEPQAGASTAAGELYFSWAGASLPSGSVIDIANIKVELGSQASSWNPAALDTLNTELLPTIEQARLDAVAAAAIEAQAKSDLAETEAKAYADGIVTAEENRAIADATNKAEAARLAAVSAAAIDAQARADAIRIGGRNLLLGTSNGVGWARSGGTANGFSSNEFWITASTSAELSYLYSPYITLPPNTQVMVSFESMQDGAVASAPDFYVLADDFPTSLAILSGTYPASTSWVKNTFPFTTIAAFLNNPVRFRLDHNGSPGGASRTYRIRNVKLELGNKATDWTPPVEDVNSAVAAAASSAATANSLLADISSDSKLTPSEKHAVRTEWDAVYNEFGGIANQANLYAITTERTAYLNQVQALGNYLNGGAAYTLGTEPPLWLRDAELSNTVNITGSTFRSNWSSLYSLRQTLLNKIADEAGKRAIWTNVGDRPSNLQALSGTESIRNDQIKMGRNLIAPLPRWTLAPTHLVQGEVRSPDGVALILGVNSIQDSISPLMTLPRNNEVYTLSFMAYCNSGTRSMSCDLFPDDLPESNFTITTTPTLYKATWTLNHPAADSCRLRFFSGVGSEIRVYAIQLEYGAEYTPWSPASEASISATNPLTTANQAQFGYLGDLNASSDLVLINPVFVTVSGNSVTKTSGDGNWNGSVHSRDGHRFAYASCTFANNYAMMMGLTADPTTDASYTSIDYAIFWVGDGRIHIYENGNFRGEFFTTAQIGDVFTVVYDGRSIFYLRNGIVFYQKGVTINEPLFLDTSLANMGGTMKNLRFGPVSQNTSTNLIDSRSWKVQTSGSQPGFGINPTSSGGDNYIDYDTIPGGDVGVLWRARSGSAVTGNAEGGWATVPFPIDHLKMYRFSVWIRAFKNGGGSMTGSYYLGVGESTVNNLAGGVNTNPYLISNARVLLIPGEWYLLVGHVYPSTYAGTISKGGIYRGSTGAKILDGTSFRWVSEQATSIHRTYQYYTTAADNFQDFWGPRVDICDGTEPSLDSLLAVGGISARNQITSQTASTFVGPQALSSGQISDLRTSNYAEDGSGFATAGAKLSSTGTALKVASNNLQVGSVTFTDYWFRLVNAIDGSLAAGTVVWRGNIDITSRGGAPNINCLTIMCNDVTEPVGNNCYMDFTWKLQPTALTDNLDSMRYMKAEIYRTLDTTPALTRTAVLCDRLYANATSSNTANSVSGSFFVMAAGLGGNSQFYHPSSPSSFYGHIRATIYNAYGASASRWYHGSSGGGGTAAMSNSDSTDLIADNTAPTGAPAAGGGGGGGGFGGYCPAPWVKITLEGGKEVDAASLATGMRVVAVNDEDLTPIKGGGEVRNVSVRWQERLRVKLTNGKATEWSMNHRFYVVGRGWTEVQKLKAGDHIAGQSESIVESILATGEGQVISFEVAGAGTYFGGEMLCHNAKYAIP